MQDIIQETEEENNHKNKQYKYEMVINRNIAFGILKDDLIEMILDEKHRKQKFMKVIEEIQKELIPIWKDRTFTRMKGIYLVDILTPIKEAIKYS